VNAVTIAIAGLAFAIAIALLLASAVTRTGFIAVMMLGLQIVDVVSDIGLLYELMIEQWCEDPPLVWACLFSVAVAGLVNIICTAALLWAVREHSSETSIFFESYSMPLSLLSVLCIAGVSVVEILTSDLFDSEFFGLFKGNDANRAWFRR